MKTKFSKNLSLNTLNKRNKESLLLELHSIKNRKINLEKIDRH